MGYEAVGGKKGILISRGLLILLLCALCLDNTQVPQEQTKPSEMRELIEMSIEELMEIPVTCDSSTKLHPGIETPDSGKNTTAEYSRRYNYA